MISYTLYTKEWSYRDKKEKRNHIRFMRSKGYAPIEIHSLSVMYIDNKINETNARYV
jgi:hypothetical protein